jgi:hypothetical protein
LTGSLAWRKQGSLADAPHHYARHHCSCRPRCDSRLCAVAHYAPRPYGVRHCEGHCRPVDSPSVQADQKDWAEPGRPARYQPGKGEARLALQAWRRRPELPLVLPAAPLHLGSACRSEPAWADQISGCRLPLIHPPVAVDLPLRSKPRADALASTSTLAHARLQPAGSYSRSNDGGIGEVSGEWRTSSTYHKPFLETSQSWAHRLC